MRRSVVPHEGHIPNSWSEFTLATVRTALDPEICRVFTLYLVSSVQDMDEIKKAGYIPRVKNICKTCGKHCTKAKCGDHYDSKNRRKVTVIDRMLLQDPYYWPAMELEDEGKEVGAKRKRQAE